MPLLKAKGNGYGKRHAAHLLGMATKLANG